MVAVQYDGEGQFVNALERYEAALQLIIQLLSKEPKGKRKELLHQQVIPLNYFVWFFLTKGFSFKASIWMSRAEMIKKQLETSPEAQYEDLSNIFTLYLLL